MHHDASSRQPPDLRALVDATLALSQELDPTAVLQKIVDAARSLVGARYAALGVGTPDQDRFDAFIHSGLDDEAVAAIGPLPEGRGLLGELLRRPGPLRLEELSRHPSSVGFPVDHPPMSTFLGVPIAVKGSVLGNLYLTEKVDGTDFTETDQMVVEALAAQAGVAIDNARLYEAQRRATDRSAALFSAVQAFAEVRDPETILQMIVDVARELVGSQYAAVGVVGDDGRTFDAFIHSGMDAADVERIGPLPEGRGLLGTVIVEGRALRLPDLGAHPASVGFPDHHPPMRSFLGVPIRSGDEVMGNLYLTNKLDGDEFTDEDEALIEALAGQAAVALDNARSYDRERKMVQRMRTLLEANLTLTRELDPERVLQTLVDRARELADAEYAALGVLSPDSEALEAFIHSGMDPEVVERIGPLPEGKGVLRAVLVAGRPVRLKRLGDHPASHGFPPEHPPMSSFLGVPIAHKGRVFGNLYLTNKRGGDFTDDDELLVSSLAAQAAVAIHNSRVYQREQELVVELQSLNEAKTEFVDVVSHEIKTPVGALVNLAEMLVEFGADMSDADRREATEAVGRQAARLSKLVEDLLDLSRLDTGEVALERAPTDVNELVAEVTTTVPDVEGVVVEIVENEPVVAEIDRAQMLQVVTNLVRNAMIHGDSRVEVSIHRFDGHFGIVVDDNGPGIDTNMRQRVFDRFERGKRPGSTGLGLAIVKHIVESHGGGVGVEQSHLGGARFTVTIPATLAASPTDRDGGRFS